MLDSVTRKPKRSPPQSRPGGAVGVGAKSLCTRCGKGRHPPGAKCPACSVVDYRCNRKGHYESQCFSKTVAPTEELTATDELTTTDAFLGTMNNEQNCSWVVSVQVGNVTLPFKLDTGAQVTAISEHTFKQLGQIQLKKPSKILYGPVRQTLEVIGQFTTKLSHKHKTAR